MELLVFGVSGLIGGVMRFKDLGPEIPRTSVKQTQNEIPAVSAISSNRADALWHVRSLWADQKLIIQRNKLHKPHLKIQ